MKKFTSRFDQSKDKQEKCRLHSRGTWWHDRAVELGLRWHIPSPLSAERGCLLFLELHEQQSRQKYWMALGLFHHVGAFGAENRGEHNAFWCAWQRSLPHCTVRQRIIIPTKKVHKSRTQLSIFLIRHKTLFIIILFQLFNVWVVVFRVIGSCIQIVFTQMMISIILTLTFVDCVFFKVIWPTGRV